MRVIAIDPSLRGTGFAVLENGAGKTRALEFGVIKNADKLLPSSCLVAIHDRLAETNQGYWCQWPSHRRRSEP